jgi:F-type H+-transporting ATPase subunit gamma
MANIRDVVRRIQSVSATQQITNAMKMVAVAKLGKVQQHMLQLRAYTEQLTTILDSVVTHTDQQGTHLYHIQRPIKTCYL